MARRTSRPRAKPAHDAGSRELATVRRRIDALDDRIVELLNRRAGLALEAGRVKARAGTPAYAPEREREVLERVVARSRGPLREESLRVIYREVVSASRALETPLVVSYLGPEAGAAHEAARRHFGRSARLLSRRTAAEVFAEVERGLATHGVVPLESSHEGTIGHTLDLLVTSELSIEAEVLLDAHHRATPGDASRFLVVGHERPAPTGADCTSLVLGLRDAPGALHRALAPLARAGVSLSRIESRPSRRRAWDHVFFVDLDGHRDDPRVARAIDRLSGSCELARVLGSYPRGRSRRGRPRTKE